MSSQCLTCSKLQSEHSQFGEPGRTSDGGAWLKATQNRDRRRILKLLHKLIAVWVNAALWIVTPVNYCIRWPFFFVTIFSHLNNISVARVVGQCEVMCKNS